MVSGAKKKSSRTAAAHPPLGAHWDGKGVHFTVFSEEAEKIELCLFEPESSKPQRSGNSFRESRRIELSSGRAGIHSVYLPGLAPGQRYGYRAHGKYDPSAGLRFNPNKLLLDPYTRAIGRPFVWSDALYDYRRPIEPGPGQSRRPYSTLDSGTVAPLGMVVDESFDWSGDRPLQTPWNKTVIYEVHVRGGTILNPAVPADARGHFAGLAAPAMIEHYQRLGITAVELLPVNPAVDEDRLVRGGLVNYWGYNPLAFFAPSPRYASTADPDGVIREFKTMVQTLHQAGIEVILDVVFNHTGESGPDGPSLSLRGLDNRAYYRLDPADPSRSWDVTGCGNTVRTSHPAAAGLVLDALRYWVEQMHVDGFRFDLGAALTRNENGEIDMTSPLIEAISSDPVVGRVKLIAEPWDLGYAGYQIGAFPPPFREWNGKFRDTVRAFWAGRHGLVGPLATRISGSSDLFSWNKRTAHFGINFITAHDGFTLHDLTAYSRKHNFVNQEGNRDGSNDDCSFNCGEEGRTDLDAVNRRRTRERMNLMASLILSTGVPMLLAGDEILRTQQGNNNCYCQDNRLSWTSWEIGEEQRHFFDFTAKLIEFRNSLPYFSRSEFFNGETQSSGLKDIGWYNAEGAEFGSDDWQDQQNQVLAILYGPPGRPAGSLKDKGASRRAVPPLLLLLNGSRSTVNFVFPQPIGRVMGKGHPTKVVFDTGRGGFNISPPENVYDSRYTLLAKSFAALLVET